MYFHLLSKWREISSLLDDFSEGEGRSEQSNQSSLSGLPDGFFSNPKSQFWSILEGLRLENVLTYFKAI
jgi:hypothetical protein